MILPPEVIPSPEISFGRLRDEDQAEWDAALECNQILYSRPNALQLIMSMRRKVFEEDVAAINSDMMEISPDEDAPRRVAEILCRNRASRLVTSLRLLTNLTYLKTPPALLYLTMLPLSYNACTRLPTQEECLAYEDIAVQYTMASRMKEADFDILVPSGTHGSSRLVLMASVAPDTFLGPTLLFGALFRLSEAGYGLDKLQKLKTLPHDIPTVEGFTTHLTHIHQIVEPKVIGKLIRLSVNRRILSRRNMGKEMLDTTPSISNASPNLAAATFASAAELAITISAFGSLISNASLPAIRENRKAVLKAKQEVVLCLGNAAEASGRAGQWRMAERLAENALNFSDSIPVEDAATIEWNIASTRGKNVRRFEVAVKEKHDGVIHCFGAFGGDYSRKYVSSVTSF